MPIDRAVLGLAGEYAVAAELCRRSIYAQLTIGNLKRADLLVFLESGGMAKIEVKAKQGRDWPNCKGICGTGTFIVFVDFEAKGENERPDFYVLTADDWRIHVEEVARSYKSKYPHRTVEITDTNLLRLPNEVNKYGKAYEGCGVRPSQIARHQGAWSRITGFLESARTGNS
jgi:hypothetical protein